MENKIKIIFLDFDGVFTSQQFYKRQNLSVEDFHKKFPGDKHGDAWDPKVIKLINKLIEKTKAKVVVSSTWRRSKNGLQSMQELWKDRNMSGEVIDITPITNNIRGIEIQEYYESLSFRHWNWDGPEVKKEKEKCTLETYCIIDDDSDMLYEQRNNFVHCSNEYGFTYKEYRKALRILTK